MKGSVRTLVCLVMCLAAVWCLPVTPAEASIKTGKATQGKSGTSSKAKKIPQKKVTPKKRSTGEAAERNKNRGKSRKKAAEKRLVVANLHPAAAARPPRVSIQERLKPMEMPEEVLSFELTDDGEPLDEHALRLIGTRYRFGGSSTRGIDCSAFVQRVYSFLKVPIPRTAREQFAMGEEISQGEMRKGDLVFFHTYARYASHVGIYLGDNRMIHASSGSRQVIISNMNTPYYRNRYLGARRLPGTSGEPLPQLLAEL